MDKFELNVEKFDGGSNNIVREVFVRGDAVAIVPYDPKTGNILMISQFLIGNYAAGEEIVSPLQVVAGGISEGETAEESAMRELAEECGLDDPSKYELFECLTFMPSPGGSSERVKTFIALCDLSGVNSDVFGVESEHEDIKTHIISLNEAMEMLYAGKITSGPAVMCLLQLQNTIIQEYISNLNYEETV